jgi:CRISPR system Cascade subunit CasE
MFMIDMQLDAAKLMRFAHMQGHPLASDEDFGYAAHAWLAAALGDLAPQPFRLFERRDGLHLLGYAQHAASALCEHARDFAEPVAAEVCYWAEVAGKSMPDAWIEGRRLGFEIRACPVSRKERERDVFLSALDRAKAGGTTPSLREKVYLDWLAQRMRAATAPGGDFIDVKGEGHGPAVELLPGWVSVVGFRRVKVLRRGKGRGHSNKRAIERPDVIFSGTLAIRNSQEFGDLLKRGVGRHRAFGFGMLLLRPAGR